jgi:hypothetical protein
MPHATWRTLIEAAIPQLQESQLLLSHDIEALDSLAKRLNETRGAGL